MNIKYLPKIVNIREIFKNKYKNKEFVIDKTGVKLVELVGISYIADEEIIFGNLNLDYAMKEVQWYNSQSLNVFDIPGKVPQVWQQVSDKNGYINSNYGWCIYSKENGEQYKHAIRELKRNKDSRRSIMIYTRPSMQWEYNKNGRSDFVCTNSAQLLIRSDKLYYILNQRSCDVIYGAKNDLYWAREIHKKAYNELKETYPELKIGELIHQVGSLHIYDKHFKLIK